MNEPSDSQRELDFTSPGGAGGFEQWQAQRSAAFTALAEKVGLPLGHQVEVWLRGDIRLRGKLGVRETRLFGEEPTHTNPQLIVDRVPFTLGELESCVRLD